MTTRAKETLKDAIHIYNAVPSDKKKELIQSVQSNLKIHYASLNSIGTGLDEDKVTAGEIFLRIFNR